MKKLIAILLLTMTSVSAMAQHHGHGGYYRGGHNSNRWVAPLVIGGVIGYGLSRSYYEPYYAPAPVYVQPPPVVYQSNCTRYIYQDQYGQTIREETRCN